MVSDFEKTMRDWKRLCDTMSKEYGSDSCKYCPLDHLSICGAIWEISQDAFGKIEEKVKKWAVENPEPQYPTWLDYLHTVGLVIKTENCTTYGFDFTKAMNPIPADIAEKLGLKPKGGDKND